MNFITTCKVCGTSYDNYMRTFKVGDTVVCRDCWEKARLQAEEDGKFWFYPNIPAFVEGIDLTLEIFDNFESLSARLEKIPQGDEKLIGGNDNTIMTISKDKKDWWVHGYTNGLSLLNLEKFEDLVGSAKNAE